MNNDYQGLSPAYTEVTEKSDYRPLDNRATVYAVLPTEHVDYPTSPTPAIQTYLTSSLMNKPVQCTCTYCHSLITTHVTQKSGVLVWIISFILILFGCWMGCCLIPFCIRDFQNTQHFCPNCKTFLGQYRPL